MRSEYAPWITDTVKRSIYHRDFLRKTAVKTGSENVNKAYKRVRNDLNKLIKNTKANYFMNALNNTKKNPKEMWKMVNKLTNKQSKTTNITNVITDDKIIEEPRVITNTFNTFFNEIRVNLAEGLPESATTPESCITLSNSIFKIQNVSETDVSKLLSTIKSSKATGHHRISPKLLRNAAGVIAPTLTKIFNQSIRTSILPEDLKFSIISPLHKTESKLQCSNYRPISVLFAVAKEFEKLISNELYIYIYIYIYMETSGILTQQQAGFRQNQSTETSLLNITNKWLLNTDKGHLNGVIFLEFKKPLIA